MTRGISAIVVGVEQYDVGRQWTLNGPARDALAFVDFLVSRGVEPSRVRCFLASSKPEKIAQDIARLAALGCHFAEPTLGAIADLVENRLPDEECDVLILYWSGHGFISGDRHFARRLFTSDATELAKRNIDLTNLLYALGSDRFPGLGRLHVIVDACANHLPLEPDEAPEYYFPHGKVVQGREQRVLFAASAGEIARNLNVEETGLFTREMLRLLKQEDGDWPPDFGKLRMDISARFSELSAREKLRQTPSFLWIIDDGEKVGTLPDADRRDLFLSRLAAFQDSFTFLGARSLCPDFRPLEIDLHLRYYANAALIKPFSAYPRRFRLTEEALAVAQARLRATRGVEKAAERHAQHILGIAEEHERYLRGQLRRGSIILLEHEMPNVAAALKWCTGGPDRMEIGLKIAGALAWYWIHTGLFEDGREYLGSLLDQTEWERGSPGHARALYADGALAFMEGHYETAEERLVEAERLYRRTPKDEDRDRRLAYTLAVLARVQDDAEQAQEACVIFHDLGDQWGRALALNDHGYVLALHNQWSQAREALNTSESIWRSLRDSWGHPLVLNNLGMVETQRRRLAEAREAHEEALGLYLHAGNDWGVAESLKFLGEVELEANDFSLAEACFREALRRLKVNPRRQLQVDCMLGLARLLERRKHMPNSEQDLEHDAQAARLLSCWSAQTAMYRLRMPPHHEKQARDLEATLRSRLRERFRAEQEKGMPEDPNKLLKPWTDSRVTDLEVGRPPRTRRKRQAEGGSDE